MVSTKDWASCPAPGLSQLWGGRLAKDVFLQASDLVSCMTQESSRLQTLSDRVLDRCQGVRRGE